MKSVKVNAVLNVLKTVCSILFPLITTPYATRVLTASNYGKVSFSSSIISYFVLISSLGIWTYVQREGPRIRDNKKSFEEFSAEIFTINIISTIIAYILLFGVIGISTKLQNYTPLLLVQSIQVFLTAIGADWVNQVYEDYFYVTVRYIVMQFLGIASLLLFVKTKQDYILYAFIMVMASAGGNLFNIFYIRRYTKLHLTNVNKCIKHLKPILKLFAVNVATTIYVSSDITILGFLASDKDTGIYKLTSNIYTIIKSLLSAILIVAMPRLSYYLGNRDKDGYLKLLKNIVDSTITFILPALAGLFMLSSQMILVLGTKEFLSGDLSLKILSISAFFSTFASIFSSSIILLYKRDNVYLFATFFSSVLNIVLNFVLIPYLSYNGAALTTLLAEMSMMVIAAYFSLQITEIRENIRYIFGSKRIIFSSMCGALIIVAVCYFALQLQMIPILRILLSVVVSGFIYLTICLVSKNYIVYNFIDSLKVKLKK